jgi:Kef-type K+ transport system membrane component KefB
VRTPGCAVVKVPAEPEIEPQPTSTETKAQQAAAASGSRVSIARRLRRRSFPFPRRDPNGLPPRLAPPVVVFELLFGILIGPHVLGIASTDEFILFFSNLGLGMLFYFAGSVGEFGPILLVTLFLIAFVLLAVGIALLSMGAVLKGWPVLERTMESSNQLAIRITVVLIFGLVGVAGHLHFDLLLGGFVAGMITRAVLRGHEVEVFDSKLSAVGFFVPFFFVYSGMTFDLGALGSAAAIAKLIMFFALFLVVRGAPALLLYRDVLSSGQRRALAGGRSGSYGALHGRRARRP